MIPPVLKDAKECGSASDGSPVDRLGLNDCIDEGAKDDEIIGLLLELLGEEDEDEELVPIILSIENPGLEELELAGFSGFSKDSNFFN